MLVGEVLTQVKTTSTKTVNSLAPNSRSVTRHASPTNNNAVAVIVEVIVEVIAEVIAEVIRPTGVRVG